MHLLATPV